MISNVYKKIINNSINENKLSQVYLIASKEQTSFDEYILYFINSVNKENNSSINDIQFGELYFWIGSEDSVINKENVLKSMSDVSETSILDPIKKKILIINNVENGTAQSLNSLLKFLENPPYNTIVFMTCNYISQVLKTIKSRAFIIEINESFKKSIEEYKPYHNYFIETNSEYNEELVSLFDEYSEAIAQSYKNPSLLLKLIVKSLDYNNKEIILNFLNLAFNDIYSIKKGLKAKNVLENKKISEEAFDYVPIYKIIKLIKETKDNFKKASNFNLQKGNLLLMLEKYYGI
ncbi:DNA polymerase III [Metamycoplasma phocicerebrale]|uniref:DNA polymerase III n=1 Tax=Metamycoplasma phocicerebrale TaxID=142649 RepID=A0A3Q9V928_9BACT|nr:DNA polymerase III [Metamycoplasma phocicerebrale]AZZ65417.1 DNA polymerase III [Metamycoplasma phocicerebrale]